MLCIARPYHFCVIDIYSVMFIPAAFGCITDKVEDLKVILIPWRVVIRILVGEFMQLKRMVKEI